MSTITATPTITPQGPLRVIDCGQHVPFYSNNGLAQITVDGDAAIIDFPCAVHVPILADGRDYPGKVLMAGNMQITLPVITVDRAAGTTWNDPATGTDWEPARNNRHHLFSDALSRRLETAIRSGEVADRFGQDGEKVATPGRVSRLLNHSCFLTVDDLPADSWAVSRTGHVHITDPQAVTSGIIAAMRRCLAAQAIAHIAYDTDVRGDEKPAADPAWCLLNPVDSPAV